MTEIDAEVSKYVLYLGKYNVLICDSCKHCISSNSNGIARHFMEKHITTWFETRQALIAYCNSLQLTDPKKVKIPLIDIERIAELELERGWRCQKQLNGKECDYCWVKKRLMENHCRDTHEWMMSKGVMWKGRWVQTFFEGKFIKYVPATDRKRIWFWSKCLIKLGRTKSWSIIWEGQEQGGEEGLEAEGVEEKDWEETGWIWRWGGLWWRWWRTERLWMERTWVDFGVGEAFKRMWTCFWSRGMACSLSISLERRWSCLI